MTQEGKPRGLPQELVWERADYRLLALVSHEIRTHLNITFGMTDTALDTRLTQEQHGYLERVRVASENLLSFTNELLDFSRIESGNFVLRPHEFSLSEHLKELDNLYALRSGERIVALSWDVSPDVPRTLIGDFNRFRQLMMAVVRNALDLEPNDLVVVFVRLVAKGNGTCLLQFSFPNSPVAAMIEKYAARLPGQCPALSEADARASLHLSIWSRLVQMMGGEIWTEADADGGFALQFTAAFEINDARTPMAETPAEAEQSGEEAESVIGEFGLHGLRSVALLDPSAHAQRLAQSLADLGYRRSAPLSARDLLSGLQQRKVSRVAVNLAVPEAWGMVRSVRNSLPRLPFAAYALSRPQRGFWFGAMDIAVGSQPTGDLYRRLRELAPRARRAMVMSSDTDVVTDLHAQLAVSPLRAMTVLTHRQLFELLPVARPDVLVLHVSPACREVFSVISRLRRPDLNGEYGDNIPLLLLLDESPSSAEPAFFVAGARTLMERANCSLEALSRLLAPVLRGTPTRP